MPQRHHRFLQGAITFLVTASAPAIASAQTPTGQTITIVTNSQSTQLLDKSGKVITRDYVPDHPFWVNRSECIADWQYQIGISTVGINGFPFEVWATNGGDCSATTARFPLNPTCWKVYSESSFYQGTSGTTTIYISARTILGEHKYLNTTDTISVIPGTEADCDPTTHKSIVPSTGVALTLYFFAFGNGSSGAPTATATWNDVGYDLIGPSPPSSVGVAAADTQLYVNWSQVLDADLAGYRIYCERPDGTSTDAGLVGSGGSGATGGSSGSSTSTDVGGSTAPEASGGATSTSASTSVANEACLDSRIWQGKLPSGVSAKGSADGKTPTSGIASGLQNGYPYACAVSAFDTRKNDGPLSVVRCGTPWWVNDFYSNYRNNANGKGGGGFCSIGHKGSAVGWLIPLASLCLLALRRLQPKTRPRNRRSAGQCHSDQLQDL
jgi:hypothetical protein